MIDYRTVGTYGPRFQDTGYFFKKYTALNGYRKSSGDLDLNYCNNLRIFRYAETLLNYAELVLMDGVAEQQGVSAKECFNQVRRRAFGTGAAAYAGKSPALFLAQRRLLPRPRP